MGSNETIDGVVTRVEHYGLYLKTSEGEAVVLIPDISTKRVPDLKAAYCAGDPVKVRLIRFVEEQGLYKATMILDSC
ncbi:MAG: S1 RNA-binding domain-containing protein [Nannocystaceae bacterium]